jgi:hypothetical protein
VQKYATSLGNSTVESVKHALFNRLLALAAAEIAALPAADIFRFGAVLAAVALPFAAHLFATPARMFANPCALNFRFLGFCAGSGNGAVPLIAAHRAF